MDKIEKLTAVAYKGEDDPEVAIASTGALDRDGEIIDPKGWELDNYEKAGRPILADHYPSIFSTIGNALWAKVSKDKLIFKPSFHEVTQEGKDAKALWDNGIVKTFSVGFLPKEWIDGKEGEGFRRKYTKQELLEISFTPVPSNPEARREIAKAFKSGLIKSEKYAELLAPGSTTIKVEDIIEEEVDDRVKAEDEYTKDEPIDEVTKPGWDETDDMIRHRIREPDTFEEGSFRTVTIKKDKPRVKAVMGKLKGEDTMTVQTVLFPKEDEWTVEKAKAWIKDHPDLVKQVMLGIFEELDELIAVIEEIEQKKKDEVIIIERDKPIVIPKDKKIEIDKEKLETLIKEQAVKTAEIARATLKGRVVEID
jgi:HK97 family phage prohead protease